MSRFEAFRAALEALSIEHGVMIHPSQYDGLQAWLITEHDGRPLYRDLQNCIPEPSEPQSTDTHLCVTIDAVFDDGVKRIASYVKSPVGKIAGPSLAELTNKLGGLPEVSGKVI